jgi:excinuclease ABC subunit C
MEEIYFPGLAEPQRFDHKTRAIRLLQNIRDEAHRFAIKYHKVLRSRRIVRKGPE